MKCRGPVFVIKTSLKMANNFECFQKTYRNSDIASRWTCCLLFDLIDCLHCNMRCAEHCWFMHRFNFLFELANGIITMRWSEHSELYFAFLQLIIEPLQLVFIDKLCFNSLGNEIHEISIGFEVMIFDCVNRFAIYELNIIECGSSSNNWCRQFHQC